jgi:hypothetical protein
MTKSNKWPTDYTLRFPRVEKIRHNKDWNEAMSLDDLKEITMDLKKKKNDDSDNENADSDKE